MHSLGRELRQLVMKDAFSSMLEEARSLQGRYSGAIAEKSRQVNVSELLPLVSGQQ